VVDARAVARLADGGLVERVDGGIRLTARGRLLGDAVTADLLA
jgi:Mn-dependent DtxR family transcriptional regulator